MKNIALAFYHLVEHYIAYNSLIDFDYKFSNMKLKLGPWKVFLVLEKPKNFIIKSWNETQFWNLSSFLNWSVSMVDTILRSKSSVILSYCISKLHYNLVVILMFILKINGRPSGEVQIHQQKEQVGADAIHVRWSFLCIWINRLPDRKNSYPEQSTRSQEQEACTISTRWVLCI